MNQEQQAAILSEQCAATGITLNDHQIEQFLLFYRFLTEKNKVMNLTAITEYEEVVRKHFVDSLSLVRVIPEPEKIASLLDLGTGAGFPGIPLKIAFPDIPMVLADSLNKRIRFLDELIDLCGFENIQTVHGRAEELARQAQYREQFQVCVSRAVANLSSLAEYCLPFVKKGGQFISYKSGDVDGEYRQAQTAISLLGGKINQEPVRFTLPGSDMQRTLLVIDKVKETPRKYPRRPGTPSKEPLGR